MKTVKNLSKKERKLCFITSIILKRKHKRREVKKLWEITFAIIKKNNLDKYDQKKMDKLKKTLEKIIILINNAQMCGIRLLPE